MSQNNQSVILGDITENSSVCHFILNLCKENEMGKSFNNSWINEMVHYYMNVNFYIFTNKMKDDKIVLFLDKNCNLF